MAINSHRELYVRLTRYSDMVILNYLQLVLCEWTFFFSWISRVVLEAAFFFSLCSPTVGWLLDSDDCLCDELWNFSSTSPFIVDISRSWCIVSCTKVCLSWFLIFPIEIGFFLNLLRTIYQITIFSTDYSDLYMSWRWIPLLVHHIAISWLRSIYRVDGGSGVFLGFSCPPQVSRRFAVRLLRCL